MDEVVILLSTYNGEKYLDEQIQSLIEQENIKVKIFVRDDGSTDATVNILKKYAELDILSFYIGSNLGSARSFMNLMIHAPQAEYYALCDQDDIWMKDKLFTAVFALKELKGPGLFYHAMNLVNSDIQKYGYYFRAEKYAQSMEYSCLFGDEIAGCTMVFNKKLLDCIRQYNPEFITMHDGWIHRVCLCVGATIIGDKTAYINYRQHGNNAVGMSKRGITTKLKNLFKKQRKFSKLAIEMINGYQKVLTENNRDFLQLISKYKSVKRKLKIISIASRVCNDKKKITELKIKLLYSSF